MKTIFLFFCLICNFAMASVQVESLDPRFDELDGFDLIEALTQNGKNSSARELLSLQQTSGPEAWRYYNLQGELELQSSQFQAARLAFDQALKILPLDKAALRDPVLISAAKTASQQHEDKACVQYFEQVKSPMTPRTILLKSSCQEKSGQLNESLQTLNIKSESKLILFEKIKFYLRLGLYSTAESEAFQHLEQSVWTASEALYLSEIFESQHLSQASFHLLEALRLKFKDDLSIQLAWAQLAYPLGIQEEAARSFVYAGLHEAKYFYNAAELFRQIGFPVQSLFLSQFVPDEAQKLKIRLATAIDREDYLEILSLEGPLSRVALQKDDEVNYAMAYSFFLSRSFDKSKLYLNRISRADLAPKALKLREQIDLQ